MSRCDIPNRDTLQNSGTLKIKDLEPYKANKLDPGYVPSMGFFLGSELHFTQEIRRRVQGEALTFYLCDCGGRGWWFCETIVKPNSIQYSYKEAAETEEEDE